MNEIVKKSLEKSQNVLEEKRKIVKRKICIKKDTHVYNNCYELRSRAINQMKSTKKLEIANFISFFVSKLKIDVLHKQLKHLSKII